MPATVTRSRENSAEILDSSQPLGLSVPAREDAPVFAPNPLAQSAPPTAYAGVEAPVDDEREDGVAWQEVAPLVDRFTNEAPDGERKRRRGTHKRHRNFVMSGVFWVGLLLGIELVGLVFLYSIDLRAIRHEKALDNEKKQITLNIALADNELAASSSPAKLDVWAAQLGYRKAQLADMDDVTSSAPAPTPATPIEAE